MSASSACGAAGGMASKTVREMPIWRSEEKARSVDESESTGTGPFSRATEVFHGGAAVDPATSE